MRQREGDGIGRGDGAWAGGGGRPGGGAGRVVKLVTHKYAGILSSTYNGNRKKYLILSGYFR